MIPVRFECGCKGSIMGTEKDPPLCAVHRKPLIRVIAPKPRVTGTVQSPLKVTP